MSSMLPGTQATSFLTPPSCPSFSCRSRLPAHMLRSTDTQPLTISLVLSCSWSRTESRTSIPPALAAAIWLASQLARALASAAPACSPALGLPSRMSPMSASTPPHLLSSSLFCALLMQALRRAPAACSLAPWVPVATSCTRPGMAMRTSSLTDGSDAHAFQMAPAASSWPTSVPAMTCCTRMGMPPSCTTCVQASSLSTIEFHSAVVAFSCAWGSALCRTSSTTRMPPASWKALRVSLQNSMALATAAVAASLTLGVPPFIAAISAWMPPCTLSCLSPSSSACRAPGRLSPTPARCLMTLARALAAFSIAAVLLPPSNLTRASIPPASTTAALLASLEPQAAAMACAALLCRSGVPLLRSATIACRPCPVALASAFWLLGLLKQASKTAPAPWACVNSSLDPCIMSMSISIPPAARKMGGGLSVPPSGGFHWLEVATGAPRGASRRALKCAGMLVSVPAGTAELLGGMSKVLIRGVLPRCTAGPAAFCSGSDSWGVCAGIWYWSGPSWFSRKGYMPWLWCMLSSTWTHVSVVGRSLGCWDQASCISLT
mmetsp:Transcript_35993/g.92016  ORF Transcript_35993/g.92016 Transcript_35993/m.92016 type:complete len:549 (+) Transcript_35993:537-2183(+)